MNNATNGNGNGHGEADARAAATFLDGFVILACLWAASPAGSAAHALGAPWWGSLLAVGLCWVASSVAVLAAFEASALRATPGKLACGLRVTDPLGGRVRYRTALRRNLAKFAWSFLGIAFLARSGWSPGGSLHDRRAGTMVVPVGREAAAAGARDGGNPPPNFPQDPDGAP